MLGVPHLMEPAQLRNCISGTLSAASGLRCFLLLTSSGDIEGHKGSDNNFYVLDFHRVFPPEKLSDEYAIYVQPQMLFVFVFVEVFV